MARPLIRKSGLTDPPRYYLLTRYRIEGDSIVASVKVDITDEIDAVLHEARQQEREALAERIEGLPNPWPFPYIGDVKRGPCGQSVEDFRAAVLAILLDPRETGG